MPTIIIDVGSGTAWMLLLVISLLSSVTAPFNANALPSRMVAPVVKVMLVSARMLPLKSVDVPSVAELPTCQNTRLSSQPWMLWIDEELAVVKVLPI